MSGSDIRKLDQALRKQGWRIEQTSRHWRYLSPDGRSIVVRATSSSDHRALANFRSCLRRAGATV